MESLQLFCGINSLAVPFPRDNRRHVSYFDIIRRELGNYYDVSGYNISSVNNNCTWHFKKVLDENFSILQIRNLQIYSLDEMRNKNFLFKLIIPKKFRDSIKRNTFDDTVIFKSVIMEASNPIFIYSGGQNDFFAFIHGGPVEVLSRDVRDKLPEDIHSLVVKSIDNVEQNWLTLKQLNPNIQIVALGFYNAPLFDKINFLIRTQEFFGKNRHKYDNCFIKMVDLYNTLLVERTQKYDFVHFADISFMDRYCATMDFHPNTKGNEMIAAAVMDTINSSILVGRGKVNY